MYVCQEAYIVVAFLLSGEKEWSKGKNILGETKRVVGTHWQYGCELMVFNKFIKVTNDNDHQYLLRKVYYVLALISEHHKHIWSTQNIWGRYYNCLHFADEETEAHRG